MYYQTDLPEENLMHQHVHKACYKRVTRKLPIIKTGQEQSQTSFEGSATSVIDISSIEVDINVTNNELNDKYEVRSHLLNPTKRRSPSKRIIERSLQLPLLHKKNTTIYPEENADTTNVYENAFEELSSWLITLLEQGIIIPMTEIKTYYEKILIRRKEPYKPASLRGSAIRSRLQFKFGKELVFYRRNDHDVFNDDMFVNDAKKLKIASISYDIINGMNERFITPKHYLLANELFRHERSSQLLTITNRLGHTCSYITMCRLQSEAAEKAKHLSDALEQVHKSTGRIRIHEFGVKVADNFDMNKETIHGENSIHILNRIIVKSPENDEVPFITMDIMDNIINEVIDSHPSSSNLQIQPSLSSNSLFYCKPFMDDSFNSTLLAYCLSKYVTSTNTDNLTISRQSSHFPLLSGFFATHLTLQSRLPHSIRFCTPIKQSPNDIATVETCLRDTKAVFIESKYQKNAVLVVDEKLYQSCVKIIRNDPDEYASVFLYPGDFHLMKTTMIVIWQILDGSGIDDVLNITYKGATLRSILNVHHFNKSLRCCKLLYTALYMLFIQSYWTSNSCTSTSPSLFEKSHSLFKNIPNKFNIDSIKQKWFKELVDEIEKENLALKISIWADDKAKQSSSFKFWYFVLHDLLEPLIILYSSIRTSNFNARNSCVSKLGPLFFATNHRNYARLCANHLFDLSKASPYLLKRLSNSFAVVRSSRPFSSIALDQTIECSINKHGKSHGGISGKFTDDTIDVWANSFAYRAVLTSVLHEICDIETEHNSIDCHIECTPQRQEKDNHELNVLLMKLKQEDIFSSANQFRKLLSGKIIHDDIIFNITSCFTRGEQAMMTFIMDRLVNKTVNYEEPLKAILRLKLTDADTYLAGQQLNSRQGSTSGLKSKDLTKTFNSIDKIMRNTLIICEQRNLPLSSVFSHEFTFAPLSLCDPHNCSTMNQQKKHSIIDFIKKEHPQLFSSAPPSLTGSQALIIDGGSILEIKPAVRGITIRQYADQLMKMFISYNFHRYDRIDIVFDSYNSKNEKCFISRHANYKQLPTYDLKCDDVLESNYHQMLHNNRAMIAARIRECWCSDNSINMLPDGKVFVIAGPNDTAVILKKHQKPVEDYLLQCNHIEADTRVFLHCQAISYENINSIMLQASDTDIILLGISHALSLNVNNLFIKSFNTRTKSHLYINIRQLAILLKQKFAIDPLLLIVIHTLSGCDTTSFIKSITKTNMLQTFLTNTHRYIYLHEFFNQSLTSDAVQCAERLLLDCYPSGTTASSLDELRGNMALHAFKESRVTFVAPTLPPTSNAFYHHCQRVARQAFIWYRVYYSDISIQSLPTCDGYVTEFGETQLKWLSITQLPSDSRLSVCGKCSTNCLRCTCGKKGLTCTLLCKCSIEKCRNRNHNAPDLSINPAAIDDADLDLNSSNISNNNSQTDHTNTESEDLSIERISFESSNISGIEYNDEHSQLSQSSCNSISLNISKNSNKDSNIIFHDHSYCKRSIDQLNDDISPTQYSKRRFIDRSLSELEVNEDSSTKSFTQSQDVRLFNSPMKSSFKVPLYTGACSQPVTSTPRITSSSQKASNSQRLSTPRANHRSRFRKVYSTKQENKSFTSSSIQ
ncbi:unnamed protein product [Adineta steineri]|uniref:Tesmin/TSO1-like CXC domain-containing protein n=1 Tax=Adineta steineri TaxID=433720 RepID=A0A815TFH4_9BILA|nr:unnamed protein product [Adineta steineri]CAF3937217.1 unnamed protein product [Adineta steineri]